MSKFNTTTARAAGRSAVRSEPLPTGRTHEGGAGYTRDARSELFLLAVTNFVGEKTFYENAHHRDNRFGQLIRTVAVEPDGLRWLTGFAGWLRNDAHMRSASLVLAAETVAARLAAGLTGGNRQIINAVLRRADEPGEFLAYWMSHNGRNLPQPVKRGVADAATRLFTERALLKYDTGSHAYRFADVIRLTHPRPNAAWQSDLFAFATARRDSTDAAIPETLPTIAKNAILRAVGSEAIEMLAADGSLADELVSAGATWEQIPSLVNGPWTKDLWESIIPSMGYMALLRNLRNFDEAGVSDEIAAQVGTRLADPEQVARSRQLPMRFLSAYNAAPNLRWSWFLQRALDASLTNIPSLAGRTLILVDTSSSMNAGFSKDGSLHRWDAATMFGLALAARAENANVFSYSTKAMEFPQITGESLLRSLERWKKGGYFLGGGTQTTQAVHALFDGHDRVVILTDEQASSSYYGDPGSVLPQTTPLYTFNLAGYRLGHAQSGIANRHVFGGLTDQMFGLIPLLEQGTNTAWPWEV